MHQGQIIQAVMQLLSQLDAPQDEYGEMAPSGSEVPIWSRLDAGQLGQSAGIMADKSALQGVRPFMAGVSEYPTDAYGMPLDDAEEGALMMGLV